MAIDEDNKKKPSRGERYRNLYDAYRDETEIDDDDFWSTLNGPVQETSGSSRKMPEPDDDYDDDEDDDDLADPEEIIAAQARAAEASASQKRSAAAAGARTSRSAAEAGTRTTRSADRTSRGTAAKTGTTRSAAAPNARASRSAEDMPERDVTAQRRKANRKKKEQERKLRRGRRMYIVFLVLWSLVLIGGGIWLWRYTGRCLVEYEKSQPENNADRLLKEFVAKVRDGSIAGEFKEFSDSEDWKLPGVFESATLIRDQYIEKLEAVKEYTCVKNEKSYSTTNPIYDIIGDGEVVARMRMVSFNPKKILAILEVCDWKIESVTAVINDDYNTKDYVYTVPSDYKVTVNGVVLTEEYIVKHGEIPKELDYVKDYVTIPTDVTYKVCDIMNKPEVVVTDAEGNRVDAALDENGCISTTQEPKKGLEAPKERYDLALLTAKKWMDFVTNDLEGSNKGLWEIRKYLLKDSLFYVKAEEYAKGVDITFVSSHTIENPEYTELEVTDYTEYSDDCFSIHIHFIKNMRLVKGNRRVTSTMDSTFYFIYCDDSDDGEDNPHWTLGDMIAGAKQNYGTEEEN